MSCLMRSVVAWLTRWHYDKTYKKTF